LRQSDLIHPINATGSSTRGGLIIIIIIIIIIITIVMGLKGSWLAHPCATFHAPHKDARLEDSFLKSYSTGQGIGHIT
jgi:flagellar basal body-associated protein FliL